MSPYALGGPDQRWSDLIEESDRLNRQLGTRPWTWRPWSMMENPYSAGTPEHEAYEIVLQRGREIEKELDELRARRYAEERKRKGASADE